MSRTDDSHAPRRRPHPQPMAARYLEFDLEREMAQVVQERDSNAQNAKTLVKYDDLRVVLTTLRAQARIASHHTEGRLTIHVVRGHLHLRAEGRTFDLTAGSLLALDRQVTHDVEALDDSAFLITVAMPARE